MIVRIKDTNIENLQHEILFETEYIRKVLKEIIANVENVAMMTAVEYGGSDEVTQTEFRFLVNGTWNEITETLENDDPSHPFSDSVMMGD